MFIRLLVWLGALAFILLFPLAIIAAFNTLFGQALEISYTWQTWCSVVILGVFFRGSKV